MGLVGLKGFHTGIILFGRGIDVMKEKLILFVGQIAKVNCDARCDKAWGRNNRSKRQVGSDVDDWEYLADDELGTAPKDPGTYEGRDAKPSDSSEFPNKWCSRECERCNMSAPGEWMNDLKLYSF